VDDAGAGLRFLLGLAMLAGAVPPDVIRRRVPNSWWVPFAMLSAVLLLGDLLQPGRDWRRLAVAYGGAAAVAGAMYAFWRLHLFGGADAKALMVLAFLAPWPSPHAPAPLPPAFDALANGSALMLALPAACLLFNVLRGDFAVPAMLLGWRAPLARARAAHVWPLQRVRGDGSVGWVYWRRASLDSLDAEYDALEAARVERVWVTAKVPFLVPLALGLALSWWTGNLLLRFAMAVSNP
jgi:preflagellin peptidase FlaK